jgi:hypothetical protein
MSEPRFKYTLNALIDQLPKNKNTAWCADQLEKIGIPERTFFSDKAIMINESTDIPGERLLIYSKFFGVEMIHLFNKNPKIRPANQRKPSRVMQKVIQRTGLKKPS